MKTYNEKQIRAHINEINHILDEDDKIGHLSDKAFKHYWQKLHQLERDLMRIYIIRQLAKKREIEELDTSLLPISEDASDSEVETCKERDITLYRSYRNSECLQK